MKVFGTVIVFVLVIFIIASLAGPISNLAQNPLATINGTVTAQKPQNISETSIGGTVKQLPGLMPLMQIFPVFFILIGLLFVTKLAGDYGSRNWSTEDDSPDIPEPPQKPDHYYPPWNCANCAGPNPENHPMCQYCGEAYAPRAVKYS